MHELTLCSKIVELITEQAKESGCIMVKKVWLAVGTLSGVDTNVLKYSFKIAASRSVAKNADLEIITVEGQALCHHCQKIISIKNYLDACSLCGLFDYQITQGKELKIVKMEAL